jgi:arylsulfatase A-like enzyme
MDSHRRKVLIIGLDGMRPDLVDPALMPNLARLVEQGTYLPDHHAVYPTHTRVNISTLASGTSPGRHGVVANVFRLNGEQDRNLAIIDTSDYAHLRALDAATGGRAVQALTLGDMLKRYERRVAVAATSSAGAGILWTHRQPYRVVNVNSHYERADLLSLREKLGPIPPADPDYRLERQMYAARAVTELFVRDDETSVIVLWLNEPDGSLHRYGLGSPQVREALEICDSVIGYVLHYLEQHGLRDQFNVMVISDHGHSTVLHHRSLAEYLDRAAHELDFDGLGLTTASDFIYVDGAPDTSTVERLARWIMEQSWAGAVFGGSAYQSLPGVLPIHALWSGVASERSPALAVSPAWSDEKNEQGVPGTVAALTEQVALRATHGSASPYDLHAFLAMSGPDIAERQVTTLPTGALDLAPTVLRLLGIAADQEFDGRVIWEAMRTADGEPGSYGTERIEPNASHPDAFAPEIVLEVVGGTTYVDRVTNGRGS